MTRGLDNLDIFYAVLVLYYWVKFRQVLDVFEKHLQIFFNLLFWLKFKSILILCFFAYSKLLRQYQAL